MNQILETWNVKWKTKRLSLVVSLPVKVVEFFENAVIIECIEQRTPIYNDGEYSDEDDYTTVVTFQKGSQKHTMRMEDYAIELDELPLSSYFKIQGDDARKLNQMVAEFNFSALARELEDSKPRRLFTWASFQ